MVICITGDSITWGAFLPYRGSWANLLRNWLESRHENISLYDLGIDKDTSKNVLARFNSEMDSRNPDIIIIAVGTNDSVYRKSQDSPETTPDEFKANIKNLIEKAKKYTSKIIFVGLAKGDDKDTVPLKRSTTGKCYTKERMREYDKYLSNISADNQIQFVNIFDQLKDEDFDDGLHPNLGGHSKIFEAVRRTLLSGGFINS